MFHWVIKWIDDTGHWQTGRGQEATQTEARIDKNRALTEIIAVGGDVQSIKNYLTNRD